MMLQLQGNNEIKEIPSAKTKETSPVVRNETVGMRNFLIKAALSFAAAAEPNVRDKICKNSAKSPPQERPPQ